ncbi:MAG: ankyrin repeat domain-containing protein [Alphaproteobacteria bacterium]|nr:MAG: ankyrin repeat domain-containing protein [Alphaproteobacteria bacterium]
MATLDDNQQAALNALLYDAVASRNLDRVQLCLSRGAQTTQANMEDYFQARNESPSPLPHFAFRYYDRAIFEALAEGGMALAEKDSFGYTVLARAVSQQKLSCVEHMLALGADPLAANHSGTTILAQARSASGAAAGDHDKIIDALLNAMPAAGADFAAAAKKAEAGAVATSEDLVVNKPITLTPRKKDGLQL